MMKNTGKLVYFILQAFILKLIMPVLASCIANQEPKNIFTESLKLLPSDARDGRVITIINYESFRKVNGISVYDEDNQRLTKEEYFEANNFIPM